MKRLAKYSPRQAAKAANKPHAAQRWGFGKLSKNFVDHWAFFHALQILALFLYLVLVRSGQWREVSGR